MKLLRIFCPNLYLKKIILIKRTTDKSFKTIEWLANKNLDDTKIVFDADNEKNLK